MKKNISINISGIIFHIEEDAYEKLREYLDAINRYFSNFEGSEEIIADIESRIAEIFLAKLNEDKQIIVDADVDSLIGTMGSIKDFQAIEEDEPLHADNDTAGQESYSGGWSDMGSKRMYRDEKRKILGGVCAGMAHYLNIDPLWIRLVAIILVLGSYGGLLIVYLIMWAVMPPNYELAEDKKLKKMYRDPDNKVIAGVSAGVATYFGVDVVVIRVLFVVFTLLGGTGLLAYFIFWVILPEARTITDKVQMQGEPVTLSNIESNIRKSLNVKDGEENPLVKMLLFPFRLIAIIINGLGKALGPFLLFIVQFIRIIAGAVFIIIGALTSFSLVVTLGILAGFLTADNWLNYPMGGWEGNGIPVDILSQSFPMITPVAGFVAVIVPCLFLILLGASIIAKRIIFNATTGWSLFAVFIISVIVLSINIPHIIFLLREDGEYQVTQTYNIEDKTAVLKLNEVGMDGYDAVYMRLRGHDGDNIEIKQTFEARGSSSADAIENAQMVDYLITQADSVLTFDSNIRFAENALFRGQNLKMTVYIPYNKPFTMDYDLKAIMRQDIYRSGYSTSQLEGNTWMFSENGRLLCTTCENYDAKPLSDSTDERAVKYNDSSFDKLYTFDERFEVIDVSTPLVVNVVRSDEFKVGLNGKKKFLDDVYVYVRDNTLYIENDEHTHRKFNNRARNSVEATIYVPYIADMELSGACKLYLNHFKQKHMDIDMSGASHAKLYDVDIEDMEIELKGASEILLSGRSNSLEAEINGACHLNGELLEVRNGFIEAHGASSARVNVTHELEINKSMAGKISNVGNARMINDRE